MEFSNFFHSAFLLGLRKTVRTTAFYSTLHTEHLPMSHWGPSFFSSCSNLKIHYIFSWFCIFIVTVSTNNLSMINQLITGALFFIMLLFSSKWKLTSHLIKQKKRMGWKDVWEILFFYRFPLSLSDWKFTTWLAAILWDFYSKLDVLKSRYSQIWIQDNFHTSLVQCLIF